MVIFKGGLWEIDWNRLKVCCIVILLLLRIAQVAPFSRNMLEMGIVVLLAPHCGLSPWIQYDVFVTVCV